MPPAVPGKVTRVLIVGAGIAGLTAANALTAAGIDCTVIEARDRIGGRLYTVEVDGHPADLGGSWIHHPHDNLVADWVEFAQVPWAVDPTGTHFTGADLGEHRQLIPAELADTGYGVFAPIEAATESALAAGLPDLSTEDAIDSHLETLAPGPERDRLRQLMAAMVEQDAAGACDQVSARWAFTGGMFVGDVIDNLPIDGYRSVLAPLAAGSDIRIGRPVRRITQTPDSVTVEGDGWSETGSHVIVTVPLGVLKANAIEFDPPLPAECQAVIERTGFGTMDKVVLAWDAPFWRDVDPRLQHGVIYPADRSQAATWTWDFGIYPTQMFLVATSTVPAMLPDPEAWAVAQFEALYGGPLPSPPTDCASTNWAADEFARGAYAHVRPGESDTDFDRLGEPVGRICFAGEHTQLARAGYADGAMASGLREAQRLLQRSTVELTAGPQPQAD